MNKMKLPVVEFHEISSGLQHSYALSIILADALQILYAIGMNISGHYGAINHKYSDFIEACRRGIMCENHADIEWASKNRIITLEVPKYRRKYKFEKSNVVSSINWCLFLIITNRERYKLFTSSISKIYLGINCYDLIEKYINCELDSFPLLHLINEHKRIFYDHLIMFEISDNELKKYYSLVLKPSEKLGMRSLKRRYDSLNKHIQRTDILMMELLNVLKENEIQHLQNIVNYL